MEKRKEKKRKVKETVGERARESEREAGAAKKERHLSLCSFFFFSFLFSICYTPVTINGEDCCSHQDIVHTRVATMGVIEVSFTMKNKKWR